MKNTSGQGKASVIPHQIRRWNWGAFFLNFLWAIGNRTWIGLLSLVPLVGWIMPFVLGFRGNIWAWQNNKWDSLGHFMRVQRRWAIWGAVVIIVYLAGSFALVWTMLYTGEPEIGEHVASVDWLPSSATDISYYKVDGFAWIKNYDCLIPEDDFRVFAAEKGWTLQEEEESLSFEKWFPNGGGASVYYNRKTTRLGVRSNHH